MVRQLTHPLLIVALLVTLIATAWEIPTAGAASATPESYQDLVFYRDCVNAAEFMPGAIFVRGEGLDEELEMDSLMRGFQIGLASDSQGNLTALRMDRLRLDLATLKKGVEFGIGGTLQTLELEPDFDPRSGGRVTLGALKSFDLNRTSGITRESLSPTSGLQLNGLFRQRYKDRWQSQTYVLRKKDGVWNLFTQKGERVRQLVTEVRVDPDFTILGNKNLTVYLTPPELPCDPETKPSVPSDLHFVRQESRHSLTENGADFPSMTCAEPWQP